MSDTSSSNATLLGIFIVWMGPTLGPYALIVFAALAGAGLALTVEKPGNWWDGIRFLALSTVIALLLTGPLAWLVERYTEVPANIALIPVAVAIGVARTKLVPFIHKLLSALAAGARLALEDADSTRGRE
jgi:hypothetical protein